MPWEQTSSPHLEHSDLSPNCFLCILSWPLPCTVHQGVQHGFWASLSKFISSVILPLTTSVAPCRIQTPISLALISVVPSKLLILPSTAPTTYLLINSKSEWGTQKIRMSVSSAPSPLRSPLCQSLSFSNTSLQYPVSPAWVAAPYTHSLTHILLSSSPPATLHPRVCKVPSHCALSACNSSPLTLTLVSSSTFFVPLHKCGFHMETHSFFVWINKQTLVYLFNQAIFLWNRDCFILNKYYFISLYSWYWRAGSR